MRQLELSNEDSLRLNVLALNAEAIRIDENRLQVLGIKGGQEMTVQLHPTGQEERYLKKVRELLAGIALDSPGGYPVYIRRWTRSGEVDHDRLAKLLKLAEPEAVMAVVCSPGLTSDLARLAWWCEPQAEYARRMLQQPHVVSSKLASELAAFLVEYLPFETDQEQIVESVRLVLQPGLIDEATKQRLWLRGRSSKSYRVGFLLSKPESLPDARPDRRDLPLLRPTLESLAERGNDYACQLIRLLESNGQTFTSTVIDTLKRPGNQDVVAALFRAIGDFYGAVRMHPESLRELPTVQVVVDGLLSGRNRALDDLYTTLPEHHAEIESMLFLAHLDEEILIPILSITDAVGTVLHKRLQPISEPLIRHLSTLLD